MILKTINKDILTVESGIICQQVNCQGVMGSGLAKQIREKWPFVFDRYLLHIYHWATCKLPVLGTSNLIELTPTLNLLNVFGQDHYGRDKQYTDYDAVEMGFIRFKHDPSSKDAQLYIPYKMGCGLAGGDWGIYSGIIEKIFPTAIVCKHEA